MDTQSLQGAFPNLEFKKDVELAPFTYMKVGGKADALVEVHTNADLYALCAFCFTQNIPFLLLGGASNVIIADSGIHKLVIKNVSDSIVIAQEEKNTYLVTADSGVITAVLSNKTMEQNLTGLEYFVGVPGTIGGAIYNNSHYTAHELIGNLVTSVEVCTPEGKRESWPIESLDFSYDHSIFQTHPAVILTATFRLTTDTPEAIKERVVTVARRRADTQPIGIPSSGCMFKNPSVSFQALKNLELTIEIPQSAIKKISDDKYNVAAGFLIDKAGLKNTAVGGAKVSDKHATFIINTGTATAQDVDTLAKMIEKKVQEMYGIALEREVFFYS